MTSGANKQCQWKIYKHIQKECHAESILGERKVRGDGDIYCGDGNRKIEMKRNELLRRIMRFAINGSISESYENSVFFSFFFFAIMHI